MSQPTPQSLLDYQYLAAVLMMLQRHSEQRFVSAQGEAPDLQDLVLTLDDGDGITEEWVEPKTRNCAWTPPDFRDEFMLANRDGIPVIEHLASHDDLAFTAVTNRDVHPRLQVLTRRTSDLRLTPNELTAEHALIKLNWRGCDLAAAAIARGLRRVAVLSFKDEASLRTSARELLRTKFDVPLVRTDQLIDDLVDVVRERSSRRELITAEDLAGLLAATSQTATLRAFRKSTETFVPPTNYGEMRDTLSEAHYVAISGEPQMGKTTCAHGLALEFRDRGYEVVEASSGQEALRSIGQEGPIVVVWDDAPGRRDMVIAEGLPHVRAALQYCDEEHKLILTAETSVARELVRWLNLYAPAHCVDDQVVHIGPDVYGDWELTAILRGYMTVHMGGAAAEDTYGASTPSPVLQLQQSAGRIIRDLRCPGGIEALVHRMLRDPLSSGSIDEAIERAKTPMLVYADELRDIADEAGRLRMAALVTIRMCTCGRRATTRARAETVYDVLSTTDSCLAAIRPSRFGATVDDLVDDHLVEMDGHVLAFRMGWHQEAVDTILSERHREPHQWLVETLKKLVVQDDPTAQRVVSDVMMNMGRLMGAKVQAAIFAAAEELPHVAANLIRELPEDESIREYEGALRQAAMAPGDGYGAVMAKLGRVREGVPALETWCLGLMAQLMKERRGGG